jgi:hypothetical protein
MAESEELKQRLFEYEQLRKEILQNDQLTLQITSATFLVISALMSFALTSAKVNDLARGFLFSLAVFAGLIGYVQNAGRVVGTRIIAAYIRTFLEPELPAVQWETRLSRFLSRRRRAWRVASVASNQAWIYGALVLANWSLSSAAFGQAWHASVGWRTTAFLVSGLGIAVALWLFRPRHDDSLYVLEWSSLRSSSLNVMQEQDLRHGHPSAIEAERKPEEEPMDRMDDSNPGMVERQLDESPMEGRSSSDTELDRELQRDRSPEREGMQGDHGMEREGIQGEGLERDSMRGDGMDRESGGTTTARDW